MKGNKTALVTGCSSGIGYATCLLLARNNFKTYGSVRDLSKAKKIQEVIDKEKLPLKIIPLDVNDPESINKAVRDILYDSGKIDVLINNAGYGMFGPIEDITIEDVKLQFETNFFGVVRLIKAIVPIMRNKDMEPLLTLVQWWGDLEFPLTLHMCLVSL